MKKSSKIYVSGHEGLLGGALVRALKAQGYSRIITRSRAQLDLTDPQKASAFFKKEKPEYVFHLAGRVGSITANMKYPVEFLYDNAMLAMNVIKSSFENDVKSLVFYGTNCAYPRLCPQPIRESYLLTGPLEPTNQAYAVGKIAGMELCRSYNEEYGTKFLTLIPASFYGPGDHFQGERSHMIPAFIKLFHEAKTCHAKSVFVANNAKKVREFMYVDDAADASIFMMKMLAAGKLDGRAGGLLYNIGTGKGLSVKALAEVIKKTVGFRGKLVWDKNGPEGMPEKTLDVRRSRKLGWQAKIGLESGVRKTYDWYLKNTA